MLYLPNSKINLGLNVLAKRADGFHNIETVFYPVNWRDALEIIENKDDSQAFRFSASGLPINSSLNQNLIYKAWQLVSALRPIPPIKVHLHKSIPMGAGLGGGSADAAFFINLLNQNFNLNLQEDEKMEIASKIGSDCAFFITNKPVFAQGKGNEFSEIKIDLSGYYILVVYPNIHSNTAEAYQNLKPSIPLHDLRSVIENRPISEWKNLLTNDFENSVFNKYPQIKELKQLLYHNGALYASMSGSGSAVYGLFTKKPDIKLPASFQYFLQNPLSKILF